MKLVKILLFSLLLFPLMPFQEAYAWPCGVLNDKEFEVAFKESPLVFTGVAGERTQQGTPFTVTHVYKSPWKSMKAETKIFVNKPYYSSWLSEFFGEETISSLAAEFKSRKEYLVLADTPEITDKEYFAHVSQCSYGEFIEPVLAELHDKKSSSANELPNSIFIGRAKKTYKLKVPQEDNTYSITLFEVLDVIRNSDHYSQLKIDGSISVAIASCSHLGTESEPELNKRYLVYTQARPAGLGRWPFGKSEDKMSAEFGEINFYSYCLGVLTVDDKETLEKLSKDTQER